MPMVDGSLYFEAVLWITETTLPHGQEEPFVTVCSPAAESQDETSAQARRLTIVEEKYAL